LTVPPGGRLRLEAAPATALLVESGIVAVRVVRATGIGSGPSAAGTGTELEGREQLVVSSGAVYAVSNSGWRPAVALVVTILPGALSTPVPSPDDEPRREIPG
jgi:hypothetical protein